MTEPILEVCNLTVKCAAPAGLITPVEDLSFEVAPGEIVGIVGESGSGKTTAIRSLIGLLDPNCWVEGGTVSFRGEQVVAPERQSLGHLRGREIGVILQNAMGSLNPLLKVRKQLGEVLRSGSSLPRAQWQGRMIDLLEQLGFSDPARVLDSYPHQLSGGMAQRVAIALATSCSPSLVVADECTTALDVTVQAEVVRLLKELVQRDAGLIFVTHDLALASELCSRLVVLYRGRAVEVGAVEDVLGNPQHTYTRSLIAALPAWAPPLAG